LSVRILIANERPEIRKLLRTFVEKDPRWEICGEAVDGGDAVNKAHLLGPELIILGLGMPVMNGIEAAREIVKFLPEAMMLLCATHVTREQREQALDAGIRGIVAKTRLGEISMALEALLRHETFFASRTGMRSTPEAKSKNPTVSAPVDTSDAVIVLQSFAVSPKIFFCEAVKDGSSPTRDDLLVDPDPLMCTQCSRTYNLHYSNVVRPVMVHLSRLLATDVVESEHPHHSARVSMELTPSNAVN